MKCRRCQIELVLTQKKFCSLSCFNMWQCESKKKGTWWQDVCGDNWEKIKLATSEMLSLKNTGDGNPMFGRRDQMHGLQRFVSGTLGKTIEEIHGEEKGKAIRALHSSQTQGELNPAFGKVYARGGRSIKGYYKEHFFRSLLEYSFMKHLEGLGYTIGAEIAYECFAIPYMFEGKPGTYIVDFHVKPENVVYEVKPSYVMKKPPARQLAKWDAARSFLSERGLEFKVVTEEDFQKRRFEDVYNVDTDVKWDERTFKYFKQTIKINV